MSVVVNSGIVLKFAGEMPSCEFGILQILSLVMAVYIELFLAEYKKSNSYD